MRCSQWFPKKDPRTASSRPDAEATWGCWWTADRRPAATYLLHRHCLLSNTHHLTPNTSRFDLSHPFAHSLLLPLLNIMWDEVKCSGKLSKIKTREQLHSPKSWVIFIARLLTEQPSPVLSLETCVDDRLRTMKGVGVLHPVEVGVPAWHITIHPLWFVLFSFSFHTLRFFFFSTVPVFLLFHILFLATSPSPLLQRKSTHPCLPLSFWVPCPSPVSLCWSCRLLESSLPSLPLSQFGCYLCHHLIFLLSANLVLWHPSNSPCTHSVVPLIACSFTPPTLLFLALSALAVWQLLERTPLSSYHQLTEPCVSASVWMRLCMFVIIEWEWVNLRMCVTVCIFLFILRCAALVFNKTIQTMCQTGFHYIVASFGSSAIV